MLGNLSRVKSAGPWVSIDISCLRLHQCVDALVLAITIGLAVSVSAQDIIEPKFLSIGGNGGLVYEADHQGNVIPDFSHCGYMGGGADIPGAPIRVVVSSTDGDNTQRIQAALDHVASLPADQTGIRGAVLLKRGRYRILGSLRMSASGVVLRGQGMGEDGTVLIAAGTDRRTLIRIAGDNNRTYLHDEPHTVIDRYVPVGAYSFRLHSTERLKAGDAVNIIRPSTQAWIDRLGTNSFGGGLRGVFAWKPGSRDVVWDRVVRSIEGNRVTVDAPITTAIEASLGGALLRPYLWPGRIHHVGVENLRCVSEFDSNNPKDENHSWTAVTIENTENAWVRRITTEHFAGSAVAIWESCRRITVQDCMSLSPVSEHGGYRRHTFFTMGQLTLFLNCWSELGRHDFSVGHCAAGPNAFVQCETVLSMGDSGPIESWSSGILYDNVNIDRNALRLCDRGSRGQGIGPSAANSVLWQCSASVIHCDSPPGAWNWAFGCWGEFEGDGFWRESNSFVRPNSLYLAQLADRLGQRSAKRVSLMTLSTSSTSSPSVELAAELTSASRQPAATLKDYILEAAERNPVPIDPERAQTLEQVLSTSWSPQRQNAQSSADKRLVLSNGWLICDGCLLAGHSGSVAWWRGNIRPQEAASFGTAVTRFVPGRIGPGFTDDLDELTNKMIVNGQALLNHNYGLWYDRRRDDHQRVRRMNGDVRPPFYEQPFARSGQGIAWDGLSKFDLTQYNLWYWSRLKEFADLCDQKGLVLLHHNYFQHNVLEAGAHWADFPWRSANNINQTDFPEPVPYAGNKRIFMDELFYDVNHPIRRDLHRAYIRKCLDNFADNTNVIQLTSAEYTGPLEFIRFWLDTVIEWKTETGHNPLIALSCTKDVQDAVLADPERCRHVSVIDIRYWWYQSDGKLYAPEGGEHLAPRQHARLLKPRGTVFSQVVRSVRQYRLNHPEKAVVYSGDETYGWAVLMGGGSLPNLPNTTDRALLGAVRRMRPVILHDDPMSQYTLAEPGEVYLIYAASGDSIQLDLTGIEGTFLARWIEPKSGKVVSSGDSIVGGQRVRLAIRFRPCMLWLTRER